MLYLHVDPGCRINDHVMYDKIIKLIITQIISVDGVLRVSDQSDGFRVNTNTREVNAVMTYRSQGLFSANFV